MNDFGKTHTAVSDLGTVATSFRASSFRYTQCPCAFFTYFRRDGPDMGLLVDVLPPRLQELAAALRGDEAESEPRAHVRILRIAGVPDATDLLVCQQAVA